MTLQLPKVYPITDRRLSGVSHAEQVERLIEGGATLIQLRDKQSCPRQFYDEAKTALRIARSHGARLIINDRVDVALALSADGVHLGQTDLPADVARSLMGRNALIGVSTHNLAQAELATQLPVDYVAFGPIFPTSTKTNPDPLVGPGSLRAVRAVVAGLPLVAIGGITISNALEAWNAGADAVASIAALVSEPARIEYHMHQMLEKAQASALG